MIPGIGRTQIMTFPPVEAVAGAGAPENVRVLRLIAVDVQAELTRLAAQMEESGILPQEQTAYLKAWIAKYLCYFEEGKKADNAADVLCKLLESIINPIMMGVPEREVMDQLMGFEEEIISLIRQLLPQEADVDDFIETHALYSQEFAMMQEQLEEHAADIEAKIAEAIESKRQSYKEQTETEVDATIDSVTAQVEALVARTLPLSHRLVATAADVGEAHNARQALEMKISAFDAKLEALAEKTTSILSKGK